MLFSLIVAMAPSPSADVIVVDPDGGGDFFEHAQLVWFPPTT